MSKRVKKTAAICLGVMALSLSSAYASGHLSVSNVVVNHKGQTFATTCVNTKGYYFEIGRPKRDEHLTVYGFGGQMPLKTIVNDLLFQGWKAVFGKTVNLHKKINWMGHKPWNAWLKQLAFEHNLAVILDWDNHRVYINRL